MPRIDNLSALEILDSRGRPTVQATMRLAGGAVATVSVPSGASTGAAEAIELRDRDPGRYGGLGCRKAVAGIVGEIAGSVCGVDFADQTELDTLLVDLDGTPKKARLGGNALLAVSLAFARACAAAENRSLYMWFAELVGNSAPSMPRLTVNLFSGGKHAGGQVAIQDVLVVPVAASTTDEALSMTYGVYQAAARLQSERYGMRLLRADEGGLAPPCTSIDEMLTLAVDSISAAGYAPGTDIALALDVASSHFYHAGRYALEAEPLTPRQMIDTLVDWKKAYPIISFEDGLAEDDWANWPALRSALTDDTLVMGDDLLCTNPRRIARAVETRSANALLLKVNQIGTLTEAAEALRMARSAGWKVTVSARSGETEDNWLADLAVGWGGDYTKIGSITQSERLAKYNRLLAIEAEMRRR